MSDDGHDHSDPTEAMPSVPRADERVGPYRLLGKIGEGGMGEVWRAEQTKPIKRTVAVKVIKAGMDTKEVVARFEAERQALALMDHPGIAKVFDAGTTDRGLPFFAMEYVKGVPITQYCDTHRLTTRERLILFQQTCEGVQHAHQKAVIHRDLKPSNVLVTEVDGKPQPKIIDFGVAKATAQKLTEMTMFTILGQLIGTPEYMSPEQAELTGEDVDTRTDVYSLGVILYELLVGALPFDPTELRKAGFEGIRKIIREQDPQRPSTRVSITGKESPAIAKQRQTELRRLAKQLKGDLDWIVMRTLEKDRNRRYASPQDLAQDIERHLKDEPVLASPPSAAYRTRKFVRRHRVGVTAAAATLIVLVAFAVTMSVQAGRIARERDRANREAEASERVSDFLADMLGDVDPARLGNTLVDQLSQQIVQAQQQGDASGAEIAEAIARFENAIQGINRADIARRLLDDEILSRAADTIEADLGEQPLISARLHETLGGTYHGLGLLAQAEEQVRKALAIRERELGSEHLLTLSSQVDLGGIYQSTYRIQQNADLSLKILATLKETVGLEHPQTARCIARLASAYYDLGRYEEADSLYALSLELRMRLLGPDHPETLRSMRLSGDLAMTQGRFAEAESLFTVALEKHERILGENDKATLWLRTFIARLHMKQGRHEEAIALLEETVERFARNWGAEHPHTLYFKVVLGNRYIRMGRYEEAELVLLETLADSRRVLGATHREVQGSYEGLAKVYEKTGRIQEKRSFFEDMVATFVAAAERADASPSHKFASAWYLLDVVPAVFVDPQLPLRIALEASEATGANSDQLNTLARAYFRAGGLDQAAETQRQAIALLDGRVDEDMDAALRRYEESIAARRR